MTALIVLLSATAIYMVEEPFEACLAVRFRSRAREITVQHEPGDPTGLKRCVSGGLITVPVALACCPSAAGH